MDYDLGKALEQINDKLDALLLKAYPEKEKEKKE